MIVFERLTALALAREYPGAPVLTPREMNSYQAKLRSRTGAEPEVSSAEQKASHKSSGPRLPSFPNVIRPGRSR